MVTKFYRIVLFSVLCSLFVDEHTDDELSTINYELKSAATDFYSPPNSKSIENQCIRTPREVGLARGTWNGIELAPKWSVEELETKQTYAVRVNYNGPNDGRNFTRIKRNDERWKESVCANPGRRLAFVFGYRNKSVIGNC